MTPGRHEVRAYSGLTFVFVVAIAYAIVAGSGILAGLPVAAKLGANAAVCVLALLVGLPVARRTLVLSLEREGDTATMRLGASTCSFPVSDAKEIRVFAGLLSLQIHVMTETDALCRLEEILGCTRPEGDKLVAWVTERFAALPVKLVNQRLA